MWEFRVTVIVTERSFNVGLKSVPAETEQCARDGFDQHSWPRRLGLNPNAVKDEKMKWIKRKTEEEILRKIVKR